MLESYMEAASSYAGDIDGLVWLILVLVGFWFILAEGVFFWLIFRFRAREGVKGKYITGELKSEKKWISIPHYLVLVCDVFIIVGAVRVWVHVKQERPPAEETVRVIGQQWAWSFVHPGPDKKLDTPDDIRAVDELHVKLDTTYHFELSSKDVLHSFSVPAFRLKQDAIPGRVITGWFKATRPGTWDIQCAEICGIGHGLMPARLVVDRPDAYERWVKANAPVVTADATPTPAPAPAPPAPEKTEDTP